MNTRHTFLLEEGTWNARGYYTDTMMQTVEVDGKAIFTHKPNIWTNESLMRLLLDNPVEIKNIYEVKPFTPASDTTTFSSLNPAVGELVGTLTIVGDMILQVYHSENFAYSGCECIIKLHDANYKSVGVFLKGDQKISSWTVQLNKEA